MTAINFSACWDFTAQQEGGYSNDQNDPGNWTGGAKGVGIFKGTNHGISAAAYPDLDIANLTLDAAGIIARRDYWNRIGGDALPVGVDLMVFDFAFNAGVRASARILQQTVGAMPDGLIGQATLHAVNLIDATTLISILDSAHEHFYDTMRDAALYSKPLDGRSVRARQQALIMLAGY